MTKLKKSITLECLIYMHRSLEVIHKNAIISSAHDRCLLINFSYPTLWHIVWMGWLDTMCQTSSRYTPTQRPPVSWYHLKMGVPHLFVYLRVNWKTGSNVTWCIRLDHTIMGLLIPGQVPKYWGEATDKPIIIKHGDDET